VRVVDHSRELNENYLIQKISAKQKAENFWEYSVSACSSLFGITEFLQLLLKRSVKLYVDEEAIVYIVVNIYETISLLDEYNLTIKPSVYRTSTIERHVFRFLSDYGERTNTGEFINIHTKRDTTITDGKAEFIKNSAYNDKSALQLSLTDKATSIVSVISRYRYKLNPNADYRFTAWIKKIITDTETNAEIKIVIHEYNQRVGGGEVAAQAITDTVDSHRYRNIGQTFIASGNWYEIEFVGNGFEGEVEFGNVRLEDMSMEVVENVGYANFAETN
jgi:hypothetical protein